jgi:TRAP transporter TAXI family solute receptor
MGIWTWSRENVRKVGLWAIVLAPYLLGVAYLVNEWLATPTLILSSGSPGGLYYKAGKDLIPVLNQAFQGKIRFEDNNSQGSNENIDRIERGLAQLAFAQDGLEAGLRVRVLARLYTSPLHIVVRRDTPIANMRDLVPSQKNSKRLRAYFGPSNSGTRIVSELVLAQYGIGVSAFEVLGSQDWTLEAASQALIKGDIDVGFFLVGLGAPAVMDLAKNGGFTLLNIDRADGIATANPYLDKIEIPAGTYASPTDFPDVPIRTVASHELLVCSRDMSSKTAYRIVEAIFTRTPDLVRTFPLITQLSQVDPQKNFYYPLHPGASSFYKRESAPPLIPWQYAGVAGTYTAALGTGFLIRLRRRRIHHLHMDLNKIEFAIKQQSGPPPSETVLNGHRLAVRAVEREAIQLFADGKIKGDPYDSLKDYIKFIHECINECQRSTARPESVASATATQSSII